MKAVQLVAGATLVASRVTFQHDSPSFYPDGFRQQAPIGGDNSHNHVSQDDGAASHSFMWNHFTSPKLESAEARESLDSIIDTVEGIHDQLRSHLTEAVDALPTLDGVVGSHGGGHDFPDLTIYQLIGLSNYTTKFYKLVSEYPDIVEALNSTSGSNYTLFVPIDSAFDRIPHHDNLEKPSKEYLEAVVKYHIGLDVYNARRILTTRTLPTFLKEELLGNEQQRLRTSVGLGGVRINYYSRVVAADIGAMNGVIHGLSSILIPPPVVGRFLTLFPAEFSTLLLAYSKTNFVEFVHHVKMAGSTVFAPSNAAFARLGIRANAFLFNTETGLKYLNAILKYHIAPNATLYSDAFYDERGGSGSDGADDADPGTTVGTEHFDLGTLLGDVHVGVDVATLAAFKVIRVNGFSYVTIADGLGKNGVVQVIDKVLIPPRRHEHEQGQFGEAIEGPIEVEDLIERFSGYVD